MSGVSRLEQKGGVKGLESMVCPIPRGVKKLLNVADERMTNWIKCLFSLIFLGTGL